MRRMSIAVLVMALVVMALPYAVFAEPVGELFDLAQPYPTLLFYTDYSPDGNWFAYVDLGHINLIPVNGGDAVTLLNIQNDLPLNDEDDILINGYHTNGCAYGLNFSPDSSKLVVGVTIFDTSKGSTWVETALADGTASTRKSNGIPSIVTIDIYTGEITYIADGQFPYWSPDGRYILFSYYDSRYYTDQVNVEHMYDGAVYDTLTGDIEFIEPSIIADYASRFVYGPDGEYYYFKVNVDDESFLSYYARVPVGGGDVEVMTDTYDGLLRYLNISDDGLWALTHDGKDALVINLKTGDIFNALTYEQQNVRNDNAAHSFDNCFWLPGCQKFGYQYDHRSVYIMDFDPANYVVPSEDAITAVDELPQQFMTLGAFPNPFNPTTTLQFTLPEAGYAELEVFSFTGQKIRSLAAGQYGAGVHSIGWDGCDEQGNPVSSGIYLSRLTSRDNVVTSRMTLVK